MNDFSDIDNLSKQVEQLMLEQQQLLSIVSHDLRSPLNRVFALIQLMQMNSSNLTVEQKNYLEKIHLVIADGLAMMRNMVDYRNLEYRSIDLHPEKFNAVTLVESCVKNFSPIAEKKNIRLTVSCEPDLTMFTDKQCMARVIDNLLANAVKFSPAGTTVSVRAGCTPAHLKIDIRDEAPGFRAEEVSRIFQKFQKLSARPTAGESSTGLGLFVAQAMAEKIGGEITCSTKAGVGSVFSAELPKTIG